MIIEFDRDYEMLLMTSKRIDSTTIEAIENILIEVSKERIFLRVSLQFITFIKNAWSSLFSNKTNKTIDYIIGKYPTLMNEAKHIDTLIMISNKGKTDCSCNCYAICDLQSLPDHIFGKLYCEDIQDAETYKFLYSELKTKPSLYLESNSFGGSNLKPLEYALNNNYIFFTIADSDKKYSSHIPTGTGFQIQQYYLNNNHQFSTYFILNVQEKENLIPTSCLKVLNTIFQPDQIKMLDIISKSSDDVKHFFDIKDGMKKENRRKIYLNPNWKALYWPVIQKARRAGIYHAEKGSKQLISGIYSSGLSRALEHINYTDFKNSLTVLQKEDLQNIFDQMVRFGYKCEIGYI